MDVHSAVNVYIHYFVWIPVFNSFGYTLGRELWGHMVILWLMEELLNFPHSPYNFMFLPEKEKGSGFSTSSKKPVMSFLLSIKSYVMILTCINLLLCWAAFHGLLGHLYMFLKISIQIRCLVINWLILFFVDELQQFFTLDASCLPVIRKYFIVSRWLCFAFFISYLWSTKILHFNLMNPNKLSSVTYVLVSCVNLVQGPRSRRFIPLFPTKSFIDFAFIFTFMSSIHFELCFHYDTDFILSYVGILS